jgi:DNA primase
VAGRIRDEDIAQVRERAAIDEVVRDHVTLRVAGGGSFKGLCPFHDEKSPSFHVTPSRGFYHCLAGETRVLTWEGAREIRDLAGGTHRILNARADWVDAPFRSYGVQRLHKVLLTRNRQQKELFATDGHRWFIRSGKSQQDSREVLTGALKAGDRLVAKFPRSRIQRTTPSPFGIAHGFTYGDGTRSGTGAMALLCPPKDIAMLKWFPNSHTSASGRNLLVHHLPAFFKELPPLDESVSYLYGWLAGYFAADGCVATDGTVMLNSADREALEFVRTVCTRLGIATYGITTQRREGFPGRPPSDVHRVHFVNEDLTQDFFLLDEHRKRFVAADKQFSRRGWVVRSVEATDRLEEVFCAEVEDGHAFALEDNILTGNCFGCQEGGDVFDFVQKIEGVGFTEAVERLAGRFGVELRYDDDRGAGRPRRQPGQRARLVEANRLAAEFYADFLLSDEAAPGRAFLAERGFERAHAEQFGIGFAPRSGDALYKHLRQKGFADEELVTAGLVGASGRGPYDRFRGRLLWPIRELSGDVVGFGARRIFDDDRIDAKYLNTPETPVYKKSQLLYGVDLARREIARSSQAVVVEGYTDVMACHLSGVPTAVATCGTAFGEDHSRILRRLMGDHDDFPGEVIFTFDGDEAGKKAALRAFEGDQQFIGQTYVAIEPGGRDPCDLRLAEGDAAVRELVARRVPLYRFVLSSVLARYDLYAGGSGIDESVRVDAIRDAARLVSSVRDKSKVEGFIRELTGMVGGDRDEVRNEVRLALSRGPARGGRNQRANAADEPAPRASSVPDPMERRFSIERDVLKLALQHPGSLQAAWADLEADDFVHPYYRSVFEAIAAQGTPADTSPEAVLRALPEAATGLVSGLSVEPLAVAGDPDARLATAYVVRLRELTALRRIEQVKSRLQRTSPVSEATAYNRMFGELVALESHRRALREQAIGSAIS